MSEDTPTYPEQLPLVDEIQDRDDSPRRRAQQEANALQINLPSPVLTAADLSQSDPISPAKGAAKAESDPQEAEMHSCAEHKQPCNLICLDSICNDFRQFVCAECMIESHADCRKEDTFTVENFDKALKPDLSRLRIPFTRFCEIISEKGLEFPLKSTIEALLTVEDEATRNITWRDFRAANPQFVLEIKEGSILLFSEKLANVAHLFVDVISKFEALVSDELFGTVLVEFEKALTDELTSNAKGDLHAAIADNFDIYSSSFSKKNYSDDSQVQEVEGEQQMPLAFADGALKKILKDGRIDNEEADGSQPRGQRLSEYTPRKAEASRKDQHGRRLTEDRQNLKKQPKLKPVKTAPPVRYFYLDTMFGKSKIVKPVHFKFLESIITPETEVKPLYDSQVDGLSAEAFHKACDGKGPTMTFVQTDLAVCGGFSDKSWNSQEQGSYVRSNKAFVFSLDKRKVYPLKQTTKSRALYQGKQFGPSFGDDLVISALMTEEWNHARLGSSYEHLGAEKPSEELFGTPKFAVNAIEVYSCVFPAGEDGAKPLIEAIKDSTILKAEDVPFLTESIGDFKTATLLYRSRETNYTPQDFHNKCDDCGPTLVVIKAGTQVGGGYTDVSWASTGGYKRSENSFIFSLTKKTVFPVKETSQNNAIFCRGEDGPNFGDRDLYISQDLATKTNRTYLGSYYKADHVHDPKGFLFGEEYFAIDEFEVYGIES